MPVIESFFDIGLDRMCEKCKRYKNAQNPFLEPIGQGQKGIMIVIDQPTESDDKKGSILSGTTRTAFMKMLKSLGYMMDRDFRIVPGVRCWGSKNPTPKNCEHCRIKLEKEIKAYNPKAIFAMGTYAIKSLLGEHLDDCSDSILSGLQIPYDDCYVYPMYSPHMLVKKEHDKNFQSYFKRTLKEALYAANDEIELPVAPDIYRDVVQLTKYEEVKDLFDRLTFFDGATAFDFETTGLKPYKAGHTITSMGIALEGEKSYAFPIDYPGHWTDEEFDSVCAMVRGYLSSQSFKIAHHSQFEKLWSRVILDTTPFINWCTMTMQHLIDNRKGGHGLKMQAFVRWGISGYDDLAAPYIEAVEGTEFNRMTEMPLGDQLFYVGSDALLTMALFLEQEVQLQDNPNGSKFFNMGLMTLSDISYNGINCDVDWYNRQEEELSEEIKKLEEELYESQEVIRHMNDNFLDTWEYTSTQQVTELLVNTLGLTTDKKTEGGNISCTEEVLSKMKHWIPAHIIKLRKLLKLRDTYLAQFMREIVDGKLHPDFTLHIARSLRSSSKNPNFQNLPKRNEEAKKRIRKGLKPSPGNKLVEVDFSGIEVSTSVLYHKDPNFLHYLESDTADMHRDNAADIWKTPSSNVSKKVRFYAKNCWTFPQFYGDYYGSCAVSLWEHRFEKLKDGTTCVDNLKKKGVKNYKHFVDWLKKCEDILWKKRFPVYTKWKDNIQRFYQKHGYIETYFGFRFTGYMDKKQIANYPIQGTAFHILLWCLIRVNQIAKQENWKSKIIGQIHDSMIIDMDPEEEHHVLSTIKHVCEREVVDRFDWITTQFRVDIEMSEVDGSFADLEEFEWKEAA